MPHVSVEKSARAIAEPARLRVFGEVGTTLDSTEHDEVCGKKSSGRVAIDELAIGEFPFEFTFD